MSPKHTVEVETAIAEAGSNILRYAKRGAISLSVIHDKERHGLEVVAADYGPGIADVPMAMRNGFSTGGGLGLGLGSMKNMMDEFRIDSQTGKGTSISMRKWSAPTTPVPDR
jgi:serine/threonine-protein kinase RsbT